MSPSRNGRNVAIRIIIGRKALFPATSYAFSTADGEMGELMRDLRIGMGDTLTPQGSYTLKHLCRSHS